MSLGALRWLVILGLALSCDAPPSTSKRLDTGRCELLEWYPDLDNDGYGANMEPLLECEAPEGYVAMDGDCDDHRASTRPGAEEACNERDDDCDGLIDEMDAEGGAGQDVPLWYLDRDGDGWGDPEQEPVASCAPFGSYTADNAQDCDDTSKYAASTHPTAASRDNSVACMQDVDGDDRGATSPLIAGVQPGSDCDDLRADVNRDAKELCDDALDSDCDGRDDSCPALRWALGEAELLLHGSEPGERLGFAMDGPVDLNGDGLDDLILGAPLDRDEIGSLTGSVQVVFGAKEIFERDLDPLVADVKLMGAEPGELVGYALSLGGDMNGDTLPDLLIGAPGATLGGGTGGLYLLQGPASEALMSLRERAACYPSSSVGARAGFALAGGGDVDGDGLDDALVGSPGLGEARLLLGSAGVLGGVLEAMSSATFSGGSTAGESLSIPGDLDDDGYHELILVDREEEGRVLVLRGAASMEDRSLKDSDVIWSGASSGLGESLNVALHAGDLCGDERPELVVGLPAYHDDKRGLGGLVLVIEAGEAMLGGVLGEGACLALPGEDGGSEMGGALAAGGDVQGDGDADLFVGAPGFRAESEDPETGFGGAYLLLQPFGEGADHVFEGGDAGARAGLSVAFAGDVEGRGGTSLLVAARGDGDAGLVHLLAGSRIP